MPHRQQQQIQTHVRPLSSALFTAPSSFEGYPISPERYFSISNLYRFFKNAISRPLPSKYYLKTTREIITLVTYFAVRERYMADLTKSTSRGTSLSAVANKVPVQSVQMCVYNPKQSPKTKLYARGWASRLVINRNDNVTEREETC